MFVSWHSINPECIMYSFNEENSFVIFTALLLLLFLACLGSWASYRNGVNDGYGYSKEPTNPGYQKAGNYLKKYCKHRWNIK